MTKPAPKTEIKVGSQVAFNKLDDAVWFDVLEIEGMMMTIREHGTDYRKQYMDKSLVVQVKEGEGSDENKRQGADDQQDQSGQHAAAPGND
jgi:hypothetical protein